MTVATYADLTRPEIRGRALAYDAALVLGGSLLLALSSHLALRIGPVPLTMQTLVVLLLGMLLGSKLGALAVLAFYAEGAAGLPVFSHAGANLPFTLGYVLGFLPAAWLCGRLAEAGWDRRFRTTLAAMVLGNLTIYALGLAWLSAQIGIEGALATGLLPFLPGDALKILLAAAVLPMGWRWIGGRHRDAD